MNTNQNCKISGAAKEAPKLIYLRSFTPVAEAGVFIDVSAGLKACSTPLPDAATSELL
jgi:hypothetical protein